MNKRINDRADEREQGLRIEGSTSNREEYRLLSRPGQRGEEWRVNSKLMESEGKPRFGFTLESHR